MWEEKLKALSEKCQLKRFDSAEDSAIAELEAGLNVELPGELKDLLKTTNGLEINSTMVVRFLDEMKKDNNEFRSEERITNSFMPFDNLLIFGTAGNGDMFAYGIINGKIDKTSIFVWNHENDSRTNIAPSLEVMLDWWVDGKITV